MLVRVTWLGIGAAVGALGAKWAERRIKRAVNRYLPASASAELAARGRSLGADVQSALADGRRAMAEREAQLRHRLTIPPSLEHSPRTSPPGVIDVGARETRR
jgi:hypothetical protein